MSEITREKVFKFLDIFDNNEEIFCITNIKVVEKESGGKIIYDITYSYDCPGLNSTNPEIVERSKKCFPFYYSKKKLGDVIYNIDDEGVIVFKNSLTEKMVEYLLMEPNELQELIGTHWWMQYKIKVMESLTIFWD